MAGRLQAQYAGLLSATSAYVEKVRPQFLSLRQQVIDIAEIIVDRVISEISCNARREFNDPTPQRALSRPSVCT